MSLSYEQCEVTVLVPEPDAPQRMPLHVPAMVEQVMEALRPAPEPEVAAPSAPVAAETEAKKPVAGTRVDEQFKGMMEDAPACDKCGSITVRNGACYRCYNCGNSMGCS